MFQHLQKVLCTATYLCSIYVFVALSCVYMLVVLRQWFWMVQTDRSMVERGEAASKPRCFVRLGIGPDTRRERTVLLPQGIYVCAYLTSRLNSPHGLWHMAARAWKYAHASCPSLWHQEHHQCANEEDPREVFAHWGFSWIGAS